MALETEILKEDLKTFATAPTHIREELLSPLLSEINEQSVDPETMSKLESPTKVETERRIDLISSATLHSSRFIEQDGDQPMDVFTGEGTIVVLSSDGRVVTHYENPFGPVHREFGLRGQSLLTYALVKAVRRLHLDLAEMRGGILARQNYDYLQKLGPEDKHVYIGDGTVYSYAVEPRFGDGSYTVGVSGAQVRRQFVSQLTDSHVEGWDLSFLAGRFDTIAAETLVEKFRNPTQEVFQLPTSIAEMFRSH